MGMKNLGNRSGIADVNITNKIYKRKKGRISDIEDTIEECDKIVYANSKCIKLLTQNIQEIS